MLSTDVSKEDHFSKGNKLAIVDAGVRTIKTMIRNYTLASGSPRYIDELDDMLENYNTSVHTSLDKRTPNEAFDDLGYQQHMYDMLHEHNDTLADKIDLDIGDYVMITRDKQQFEKENTNFMSDIYVIYEKVGHKYILIDADGDEVKRKYKYFELLKVDPSELENHIDEKELNDVKKLHSSILRTQKALNVATDYDKVRKDIQENKAKDVVVQNGVKRNADRNMRSKRQT